MDTLLDHTPTAHDTGSPNRILVVDDVDFNTEIVQVSLEAQGFVVETADNGSEALSMIRETDFDLVLLDIMMPGMDGYSVLREIRKTRSMADLPVIMLTAKNEADDIVRALKLGANDYVTKPIKFDVVSARMRTHLALKETAQQLKQANETVQEKSEHLQMIMDSATIAIFALDTSGIITSANETAAEICNTDVEHLIGTSLSGLISEDARSDTETVLRKVTREGYFITNFETTLQCPDGSPRTISLGLRAIHRDGKIIGVTGTAEDITPIRAQREVLSEYVRKMEKPDQKILSLLQPSKGIESLDTQFQPNFMDANDDGDQHSGLDDMEKRQHPRRRTFKGGKLSFNNETSLMDCIVRDLSDGGAKLQFESHFDCPRFTTLRFSDGTSYECEVRRFANKTMGVKFLKKRKMA
jgi:PAS domain S-box-containing protein